MFNTIQTEAAHELTETLLEIARLDREIGLLNNVQRYQRGCAASQNRARIAERQDELATWVYLKGVQERLADNG